MILSISYIIANDKMSFLEQLKKNTGHKYTENGALTNSSSLNANLDYFSLAGAMRSDISNATNLFMKAYYTDPLMAVRTLFYIRDIRGGQGEREIFRAGFKKLMQIDKPVAEKLLQFIPEYGRWDDLISFYEDSKEVVMGIITIQLMDDMTKLAKGENISLLAKWMPSENASSKESMKLAREFQKGLKLTPKQYRKNLSRLRAHLTLLEQKMSANKWSDIDYSKLPSQAGRKFVDAFKRHDEERYTEYLESVMKGEKKMNTETLFTYEVFDAVQKDEKAADAMWKSLPDYTNGTDALIVADVSGSMEGRPMSVSVSLALYFAERNKGIFNNTFMTFSESPRLVNVVGDTLSQKLSMIENQEWGMNTNLEAVFNVILKSAVKYGAPQSDLPKVIYIISDMEFDQATSGDDETIFEGAEKAYKAAGYELPHLVFWNVDARQTQAPATKFDNRVTLISGLSQSTFRYAVEGKSPMELMESVINSERYSKIVL